MIKRYNKKLLKKSIIVKLIIGLLIMIPGIVGLIITENNEVFDKLYIEIICTCMFIVGVSFLVLIAKDFRKLDIEENIEQIEKYISECDSYISMLYKMHLNNDLITKLAEKNIKLFCNYTITYEDEYVIEIINNDKKLIIEFYEDKVMYTILKIDKYEFDINEAKWNAVEANLESAMINAGLREKSETPAIEAGFTNLTKQMNQILNKVMK